MKQKFTVQELTTMALLAALLCVSSYISIQLPFSVIPFTAQTIIINLAALLLKPRKSFIPILVWILLGAVGLPVFSGGKGGFGIILGATGGYIIGYFFSVLLVSIVRGKKNHYIRNLISVICVGMTVIYAIGIPWMKFVTNIGWKAAFLSGCVPFLVTDIIKCVIAVSIAKPLYRVVNSFEDTNPKK